MIFSLLLSIFFGLVAAAALVVNATMIARGLRVARAIRAELAAMDRAALAPAPILRDRLAFA